MTRLCVPRDLSDALPLFPLSTDWVKLVFDNSVVRHASIEGQSAGSSMHAVNNLNITNVTGVFTFHPPGREERSGAINFNLVFGVVKDLNPLVIWEPYKVRDLAIKVDKLLTLLNKFWPFSK